MSKLLRPNGRPRWQPDDEQRAYIRNLASEGYPQEVIAKVVGISRSTLKRRCPQELHDGSLLAIARLAAVAYEMAIAGDIKMLQFLLKCRMGWSEPSYDQNSKITFVPKSGK